MGNHHMLVQQHRQPEPAQLHNPGIGARVILVVAGHKIRAVTRAQISQRRHMRRQLADLAVDQITGNGHQVSLQRVDLVHDAPQIRPAYRRPDMDVADLRHGKTVPGRRQTNDRNVDPHHRRRSPGVEKPQQRDQPGKQRHGLGRQAAPLRQRQRAGCQQVSQP